MSKKLFILKQALIILIIVVLNPIIAMAEGRNIYSTDEDGVWRPTDEVSKTFTIKNIWKEKCFLESITFDGTKIRDVDTGKEYSISEAEKEGILDDEYNVKVIMGNETLYSGTMKDLITGIIMLDDPIFMDLDSKVDFNITIDFNSLSGNEYQNKCYEYILYPNAFKLVEDTVPEIPNKFITKTGSIINNTNLFILSLTVISLGILLLGLPKKDKRGDDV